MLYLGFSTSNSRLLYDHGSCRSHFTIAVHWLPKNSYNSERYIVNLAVKWHQPVSLNLQHYVGVVASHNMLLKDWWMLLLRINRALMRVRGKNIYIYIYFFIFFVSVRPTSLSCDFCLQTCQHCIIPWNLMELLFSSSTSAIALYSPTFAS